MNKSKSTSNNVHEISTSPAIIVDGYIREWQAKQVSTLIPKEIRIICTNFYINCYSLYLVIAPDDEIYENPTDILCQSELIHDNIQLISTSFCSLHIIDKNHNHLVSGFNDENQLGFKQTKLRETNTFNKLIMNDFFNKKNMKINYITNSKIEYSKHIFIKTNNNEIYSFGANDKSQCGYKKNGELEEPKLLKYFINFKINIINIEKGDDHSIFLSDQHILYGCGSNKYYQMGLNENKIYHEIINISQFIVFPKTFNQPINKLKCVSFATFLIDADNVLYGVGQNSSSVLGLNESIELVKQFAKIPVSGKVKQFDCGSDHCCLMNDAFNIITFGLNFTGQCGMSYKDKKVFNVINSSLNSNVDVNDEWKIVCGYYNTYIIDDKCNIYAFGFNRSGGCLVDNNMENKRQDIFIPVFIDNKTILKKYTNNKKIVEIVPAHDGVYILTE